MANTLTVVAAGDEVIGYWLTQLGIAHPSTAGRMPTADEVRAVLTELDWLHTESVSPGHWHASVESRDSRYPPISEISVSDTIYTFRLGPLFGPFEIIRRLAEFCGPQVAIEASGARTVIIEADSFYEVVHEALTGETPTPPYDAWS